MEKQAIITLVAPQNISKVWPLAAPLLNTALEFQRTHDIEHVRRKVLSGRADLWVQWMEGFGVEAACVTEFIDYPLGLWLNVWLMGAHPDKRLMKVEFQNEIVAYARANRCAGIRNEGRLGWMKLHNLLGDVNSDTVIFRYALEY